MPSPRIRTIYVNARRIEEHTHVTVRIGWAYGQPDVPHPIGAGRGVRDDAGTCGDLILRAGEWEPFIRALAVGGHATGVRVLWAQNPDDNRSLWNAHPDAPAIVGTTDPVPWERAGA